MSATLGFFLKELTTGLKH
ncbi:MAG: hypothetical protein QM775_06005 [Pirellulales bacterium]